MSTPPAGCPTEETGLGATLFVFDGGLKPENLSQLMGGSSGDVALLPLTSDFLLLESVTKWFENQGAAAITLMDAASTVDTEVGVIRDEISAWASRTGDSQIAGRSLKEWFYLPNYRLSTWWLSLVAEKNSLKTRAYLQLAQLRALEKLLRGGTYTRLLTALSDETLDQATALLARAQNISHTRQTFTAGASGRDTWQRRLHRSGWSGKLMLGFLAWLRLCYQAIYLRHRLGAPKAMGDGLLFVTYFPAYEAKAAQTGVFRNRYTGDLQDLLDRLNIPVGWLLMYVPINGASFRQAVGDALRFRKSGTRLFFPEQFLSPGHLLAVLGLWLRQAWRARRLEQETLAVISAEPPLIPAARSILTDLWRTSFAAPPALLAMAYMVQFRALWQRTPRPDALAYIFEKQGWENALLATRRGLADDVPAIAMQHTVVARDYYHYFASPADTGVSAGDLALPQAEVLAVNGPAVATLLAPCRYRGVREVEALRFGHLAQKMPMVPTADQEVSPMLLVIGSYDREEARAIAHLVHAAFPLAREVAIMLKSHPGTPFEAIYSDLGIDWAACGYQMAQGGVDEFLYRATAVLVGSSAVAVEAAMKGKPIIVPRFADTMVMSPIAGLEGWSAMQACNPYELRQCWMTAKGSGAPSPPPDHGSYWHIETDLKRWAALLRELGLPRINDANTLTEINP